MIETSKISMYGDDLKFADQVDQSSLAARAKQFQRAISRWENEGGADGDQLPALSPDQSTRCSAQTDVALTNAELVQLQVRVIALENLVIALLTGAPDQTLCTARALATDISPRPTSIPHSLTIHASQLMAHMMDRAALVPLRLSKK